MLDPRIVARLRQRRDELDADGKLLTRSQLAVYYGSFRSRFGPEQLRALDGEALLETMHGTGSKDSMVYWLEFKNDEEFPARFGSIAGGSALKFGVFRRAETGEWTTADKGNFPVAIGVDDAVGIARRHRDQLLAAAEAVQRMPANGTDADYRVLQAELDAVAPGVSDLGWGHKYLSLLFPDKLDDYHNSAWQRFHLLKLLQLPPEGKGRYICAGRFVSAATEMELPMATLTALLNSVHGPKHDYWRVGTGSDGGGSQWGLMRDGGFISIGWADLGDLSWYGGDKGSQDRLNTLVGAAYPGNPQTVGRTRSQIGAFITGIGEGDLVLASQGAQVVGIGRVTEGYTYEPSQEFAHRRGVEWLSLDGWTMPEPEGLRTAIHRMAKHDSNILEAERRLQGGQRSVSAAADQPTRQRVPRLEGVGGRIQSVLQRKRQVILYGPPGTGKTYWAERTARELAAHGLYGRPFGELHADEAALIAGSSEQPGLVRMCCFHPAYGYEDFIEGFRPEAAGGQLTFRLTDGLFKRLCREAAERPEVGHYLIIDEINRGDIPRIFGELLTVLEVDRRGTPITLPLSREAFIVPANLYLIGTMNTADRSISLLDTALRRRFGFVEVMPDAETLAGHIIAGIPIGPWLSALNRRICQSVGRDARNLQVGHSYLLRGGRPLPDLASLRRVIRDDIIPLIEEYCYDDFEALRSIVGGALVDVAGQRIRQELLDGSRDSDLIQGLLEPCPEILASAQMLFAADGGDDALSGDQEEGEGEDGEQQ